MSRSESGRCALEGMLVGSVLNALTTRTEIETILRVRAPEWEVFAHYGKQTPDQLRVRIARAISRFDAHRGRSERPGQVDLAAQLARLADLHAQGALTDGEFIAAKARLLGTD